MNYDAPSREGVGAVCDRPRDGRPVPYGVWSKAVVGADAHIRPRELIVAVSLCDEFVGVDEGIDPYDFVVYG